MEDEERGAWFELTVQGMDGEGVEVPRLARLLESLSSSFYAIARAKIGDEGARPGPRTAAEDALAAVRLVRVEPGSATIELAPPPLAAQGRLPIGDVATPDDVAHDFFEEARRVEAGEPAEEGRWEIRRRVREVIESAGEIGSRAEIVYRPAIARPGISERVLRATVRTREVRVQEPLERSTRRRHLSGHAYMVDVEPGRQRLRIKMPDGRDTTLDVDEELIEHIRAALDKVVEIEIEEEWEGNVASSRVARSLAVLPSSGPGSDEPPKSVAQLAREQNLPKERPDYVALTSAIWGTEGEVARFQEQVREARRAPPA